MNADDRIDQTIDEITEKHPDGIKGPDLIDEVIAAIGVDEKNAEIVIPSRTVLRDAWIAQKVRATTRRRRGQLRPALETIRDALLGETLLADDDPILGLAFPTSDGDGTMRTLRFWAIADIESIRDTSRDNRIEVDKADDDLESLANTVIAEMRRRRSDGLGEALFQ